MFSGWTVSKGVWELDTSEGKVFSKSIDFVITRMNNDTTNQIAFKINSNMSRLCYVFQLKDNGVLKVFDYVPKCNGG